MTEVRSRKVAVYALKSLYLQKVANVTSVAVDHLKKVLNDIPHVTMYTSSTVYLYHALYCIKRVLLVYCSWILEEWVTRKEYRYPCSIANTYYSTLSLSSGSVMYTNLVGYLQAGLFRVDYIKCQSG